MSIPDHNPAAAAHDSDAKALAAHLRQTGKIAAILQSADAEVVARLFDTAAGLTQQLKGRQIHLRCLLEISNHCCCRCAYCGINAEQTGLQRYRMTREQILAAAGRGYDCGCRTVVMQAGEDPCITRAWLAEVIREIKRRYGMAVTLSLGERTHDELTAWRDAGADRYLLRFETGDPVLFNRLHPHAVDGLNRRLELLQRLRAIGYEIGSGVLVGLPGQTVDGLAADLLAYRELDLDMIGMGPFIPDPQTPLAAELDPQAPLAADRLEITYRCLAVARILCPEANIPATTATVSLDHAHTYQNAFDCGANVVMLNFTPDEYRALYALYPDKFAFGRDGLTADRVRTWLQQHDRTPATSRGFRCDGPRTAASSTKA